MAKDPLAIASICMERSLHAAIKTRAAEAERSVSAEVRYALRRHLQTDSGGLAPGQGGGNRGSG